MQAGRARAREFRLLAGYTHWHDGSLAAEVARGDWWLVAASREYLLSLVRGQCHCVGLWMRSRINQICAMCFSDWLQALSIFCVCMQLRLSGWSYQAWLICSALCKILVPGNLSIAAQSLSAATPAQK